MSVLDPASLAWDVRFIYLFMGIPGVGSPPCTALRACRVPCQEQESPTCPPDRPSKILLVQVGTLSSSHPSFGVSVFFLSFSRSSGPLGALLSSPALDVRLMTALQVLQGSGIFPRPFAVRAIHSPYLLPTYLKPSRGGVGRPLPILCMCQSVSVVLLAYWETLSLSVCDGSDMETCQG